MLCWLIVQFGLEVFFNFANVTSSEQVKVVILLERNSYSKDQWARTFFNIGTAFISAYFDDFLNFFSVPGLYITL
jgi:hypothetical protein